MKRFALWIFAFLLLAASAVSETVAVGQRYEVRADLSESETRALAREMDRRFEVYNGLFRFDPARLPGKLKVRAFANKKDYDDYLWTTLGEPREGACYLHYSRPDRSELVVFERGDGIFSHQAFVQFIRAFVPQAPIWMREGFAVVFDPLSYDPGRDAFQFEENLAWLETVKKWGEDAPKLENILVAEEPGGLWTDRLVPAAWSLASFLLNSPDEEYRRFLYESFLLMKPELTAAENSSIVARRGAAWIDPVRAQTDYEAYLRSRRTFAELIDDGRAAYAAKKAEDAEKAFLSAADLKPNHYAPYYYLGLLAYEKKEFGSAETNYKKALEFGADEALCSFALGVNAAADGRSNQAREYLERAKAVAPTRYAAKVDELLAKLR